MYTNKGFVTGNFLSKPELSFAVRACRIIDIREYEKDGKKGTAIFFVKADGKEDSIYASGTVENVLSQMPG